MSCARIRMSVGPPRWTWRSMCSTACWSWDARTMSASPELAGAGVSAPTPLIRATQPRVDEGTRSNRGRDDRLDRGLLHVGHHVQDHLTAALDQAEDGWLVLLQRAPARRAGQPPTASEPPLLATAAGWPLCPATT